MNDELSLGQRILAAIRGGSAPRPARLAAARGALPLSPAELIALQVLLARDADDDVRMAAEASLAALDAETADALAADRDAPHEVLIYVAEGAPRWPSAAEALAARRGLPAGAYRALAGGAAPDQLARLSVNEEALAADPVLGRLLIDNPALPAAARGRLLDVLDELGKAAAATPAPGAGSATGDADAELDQALAGATTAARDPFLAALGIDAEVEALLPELGLSFLPEELGERSALLGEAEEGDDTSLLARIARLNVGQKLRVALFGNREARTLLVRDSNRIVAAAVVKNPKFTDSEAESVASSRNVLTDVLRMLARHREFAKLYSVQHNLVRNPRCPADIALGLVASLHERDLRLLLRNRNVSEAVRRQAKRITEAREARQKARLGPAKH